MRQRTFVTADPHFGHKGVTQFKSPDGLSKLRPWDTTEEMDEALVTYWNETVRPEDKVYILGDFCINRRALPIAGKLNGRKILVKGNHDVFRANEYLEYFDDIRACQVWHGAVGTHIPIHESQLNRFRHNIHGHLHADIVKHEINVDTGIGEMTEYVPDPNYTCVSVEQTNFRPVDLEQLLERIRNE